MQTLWFFKVARVKHIVLLWQPRLASILTTSTTPKLFIYTILSRRVCNCVDTISEVFFFGRCTCLRQRAGSCSIGPAVTVSKRLNMSGAGIGQPWCRLLLFCQEKPTKILLRQMPMLVAFPTLRHLSKFWEEVNLEELGAQGRTSILTLPSHVSQSIGQHLVFFLLCRNGRLDERAKGTV